MPFCQMILVFVRGLIVSRARLSVATGLRGKADRIDPAETGIEEIQTAPISSSSGLIPYPSGQSQSTR